MKYIISDVSLYDNFYVKVYIDGLSILHNELYSSDYFHTDEMFERVRNQLTILLDHCKDIKYITITGKLFSNILGLLEYVKDTELKQNIYDTIIKEK